MNLKYFGLGLVLMAVIFLAVRYVKAPEVVEQEFVNVEPTHPEVIVPENPEGEADPNVMKLDMKSWRWLRTEMNDGTTITPKNADKFNLTFLPAQAGKNDGTFSASTDCNGVGGEYKTGAGKTITFTNMMSTLMFCTESNETEFRQVLENTSSYMFTSRGELILELKYDSGTATFR